MYMYFTIYIYICLSSLKESIAIEKESKTLLMPEVHVTAKTRRAVDFLVALVGYQRCWHAQQRQGA